MYMYPFRVLSNTSRCTFLDSAVNFHPEKIYVQDVEYLQIIFSFELKSSRNIHNYVLLYV